MSEANGHTFGLIEDKFDYPGYVTGVPRLYPAVRFTYRPMLRSERSRLGRVADTAGDGWVKVMAQAMAKRILSWDLAGKEGVLPHDEATLLKLVPALFDRLFAIVSGELPSDPDPQNLQAENFDEEKVQKN